MTDTAMTPPLCRALDRALRQRGITKADFARMLKVNKSSVTLWTTERSPDWQVVMRAERALRMRKGELYVMADLADVPGGAPEQLMSTDQRLIPMCRQMAQENYRSLLAMSAEAIDIADNETPAARNRMAASATS